MHALGLLFFGFIALFWLTHGLRVAIGAARLPWLKHFEPAADAECPRISILFAARDEEEKLPAALATLMGIDYPYLEVVAVDDRSKDATGEILETFAAAHPRLRVVHVKELPSGWLGKPHALEKAYEASTGEWLLFTDADVRFQREALRRAVALMKQRKLDHLTLLTDVEMSGFWETVLLTFFGMAFHLGNNPGGVHDPSSSAYVGVGAFQLTSRAAYEASGTHRRLAMEVVDDMKLAKMIRQAGFRSAVGVSEDAVVVRWHAGLGNLIHGTTKNFFAAFGYNLPFALVGFLGMFAVNILPFFGLVFGGGWVRLFSAVAVGIALCFHSGVDVVMRVSPLYALTQPLGALLFCYMLLRSTVVTLWQGGVTWRDTFYPLEELKKRVV
ncbi:MAG TPA: glycosyltransferase [Candidatus Angelobacter sp.]|nr:glycosyltransferase [Candidatus Angelobacter sp.]